MSEFELNKQQALQYHQTGDFVKARDLYKSCLAIKSDDVDVLNMLAALEASQNNKSEALQLLAKAIKIEPEYGYLFYSRALILIQAGSLDEAESDLQQALKIDPNLQQAQRILAHVYQQKELYDKAVLVIHDYQQKYANEAELEVELGYCFQKMGQLDLAIKHYQASTLSQQNADVYFNLAMCQTHTYDWKNAENNISKAVSIQTQNLKFKSWDLYIRKLNCNWDNYQSDVDKLIQDIEQSETEKFNSIPPGYILNVLGVDDKLHAKAIKWMHQVVKQPVTKLIHKKPDKNSKIKIGYLSPDFRKHAVGMLLSPVIPYHDKSKFEVHAYSLRETNDELNIKFKNDFEHYLDVCSLTNRQIAEKINQDNIDILIDLAGITDGARPEILDSRPAPIQIGLWGYLNSIGGNLWDYIITDKEIWPETASEHYTEKPIFLDRSILSSSIITSDKPVSQQPSSFPDDAVVIGSFNNSYKITERWLLGWLEIIRTNKNCWFWLYVPELHIKNNLMAIAEKHLDDTSRIIFAEKVEYDEHLSRMQRVDIFADSFGYNAGASGTAAIASGVPILTLKGSSMLARMGASINRDLGMDELICETEKQYWDKAIQIVSDKQNIKKLKQQLKQNIDKRQFGDAKQFCISLEKILTDLMVNN